MTSKQRAFLRSQANSLDVVAHVGKQEVTPELVASIDEVLEKRELIKISVLNNCMATPKDVAELISGRTRSQTVSVVGRKIVLFRKRKTSPKIDIDKIK